MIELESSTTKETLQQLLSFIDHTSLNATDTEASMARFFELAQVPYGHVAAVCVYPRFVKLAKAAFKTSSTHVATVVNFPGGDGPLEESLIAIERALKEGADELDVVFPYTRYLAGQEKEAYDFVAACKRACGTAILKMILETGAFKNDSDIARASRMILNAGADFLKTSTGKGLPGATLETVSILLFAVKELTPVLKRSLGVKVSGGVRRVSDALPYMQLANQIMGSRFLSPATFRIGSSHLLADVTAMIAQAPAT